jgi:hypothetical protein
MAGFPTRVEANQRLLPTQSGYLLVELNSLEPVFRACRPGEETSAASPCMKSNGDITMLMVPSRHVDIPPRGRKARHHSNTTSSLVLSPTVMTCSLPASFESKSNGVTKSSFVRGNEPMCAACSAVSMVAVPNQRGSVGPSGRMMFVWALQSQPQDVFSH